MTEYDMGFRMVPSGGENEFKSHLQKEIFGTFKGSFQKFLTITLVIFIWIYIYIPQM